MNTTLKSNVSKPNRLHIGHLVKDVFNESGLSVTEFARLINCARPNVYAIFERYDISIEQLLNISDALNHNFLEDIMRHSGMLSPHYPEQLNITIRLETFVSNTNKSDRIVDLLNELVKECDEGKVSFETQNNTGL